MRVDLLISLVSWTSASAAAAIVAFTVIYLCSDDGCFEIENSSKHTHTHTRALFSQLSNESVDILFVLFWTITDNGKVII